MEALSRCEELIRTSEQNIHDTAINFIQEIRSNEKQTVEELHAVYGSDCMEYMDCKKDLAVQVINVYISSNTEKSEKNAVLLKIKQR